MILRRVDLESLDLESRSLRSTGDATAAGLGGFFFAILDICLGWGVQAVELERAESDLFSYAHAHDHLSLSAMPVGSCSVMAHMVAAAAMPCLRIASLR